MEPHGKVARGADSHLGSESGVISNSPGCPFVIQSKCWSLEWLIYMQLMAELELEPGSLGAFPSICLVEMNFK